MQITNPIMYSSYFVHIHASQVAHTIIVKRVFSLKTDNI